MKFYVAYLILVPSHSRKPHLPTCPQFHSSFCSVLHTNSRPLSFSSDCTRRHSVVHRCSNRPGCRSFAEVVEQVPRQMQTAAHLEGLPIDNNNGIALADFLGSPLLFPIAIKDAFTGRVMNVDSKRVRFYAPQGTAFVEMQECQLLCRILLHAVETFLHFNYCILITSTYRYRWLAWLPIWLCN